MAAVLPVVIWLCTVCVWLLITLLVALYGSLQFSGGQLSALCVTPCNFPGGQLSSILTDPLHQLHYFYDGFVFDHFEI